MANPSVTEDAVLAALSHVQDPDLGRDIVSLGMVKDIVISGDKVAFTVELTTPACPLKEQIEEDCRQAVRQLDGVEEIEIEMSSRVMAGRGSGQEALVPGVRNIIAVASGKGGVGKSTVALNLAIALAESGAKVGLLDADVYGPSIPLMVGEEGQPEVVNSKIIPVDKFDIKIMSLGFLLPSDQPVMWRGPMIHSAIQQMLRDVEWGELDYLVVDLPPGTGDAQISLSQSVPLTGTVIVMTSQAVALTIATKALVMFRQMNVPILGIIENMSTFHCPNCHEETNIFGHGASQEASDRLGVPFLGSIPLTPELSRSGDQGEPIMATKPNGPEADAFRNAAQLLAARVSVVAMMRSEPSGV
ncbi:MAG: Mrp/NBP35 family ATP-binding protein [Armatimonadetes bacterium]|nr:Mrp/NBP35 family ATP-binding protein [Armatimonadota bacterium]